MKRIALFLISFAVFAQSDTRRTIIPLQDDSATGMLVFRELYGNGSNFTGLSAQNAIASNVELKLPAAYPTVNGECVKGTTLGVLSFGACDSLWTVSGSDVYRATGKVGIQKTTPTQTLHVFAPSASPATTGTTQNGILRVEGDATNTLDIGAYAGSPFGVWLQATNTTALGTTYPLILNPTGGNVGIGMTNPTSTLHVAGSAAITSTLAITGAATFASTGEFTGDLDMLGSFNYMYGTMAPQTTGTGSIGTSSLRYGDYFGVRGDFRLGATGYSQPVTISNGTVGFNGSCLGVAGHDSGATVYTLGRLCAKFESALFTDEIVELQTVTGSGTYETALSAKNTVVSVPGSIVTPKIGRSTSAALAFFTDATDRWEITSAGMWLPRATDTYDIGNLTTPMRVRGVYAKILDTAVSGGTGDYIQTRKLQLFDNTGSTTGASSWDFNVVMSGVGAGQNSYLYLRDNGGTNVFRSERIISGSAVDRTYWYTDILPDADNSQNLGGPSNRFNVAYASQLGTSSYPTTVWGGNSSFTQLSSDGSVTVGSNLIFGATTVINSSRNLVGLNAIAQDITLSINEAYDIGSTSARLDLIYARGYRAYDGSYDRVSLNNPGSGSNAGNAWAVRDASNTLVGYLTYSGTLSATTFTGTNVTFSGTMTPPSGTAFSGTKTVRASGGASDCTLTFSQGIMTGGTC